MNNTQFSAFAESTAILFYVSAILCVVTVIIAIITIVNLSAIKKLKRDYNAFMLRKTKEGVSIEDLLTECLSETKSASAQAMQLSQRVLTLETRLPQCFNKIGIVRYNPFDDMGGDLSYAIALLDDTNTGVVLNGIHNRAGSYTYAKSIIGGEADKHKLSEEESESVRLAITTVRQSI